MGLEQGRYIPEEKGSRKGFEPFVGSEQDSFYLFVNAYNGIYARDMALNRKAVERTLQLAHLDGKVILANSSLSRSRAIDGPNPDGSVAQKRNTVFGAKLEDDKENPLYKVTPIPKGWRIEINDNKLMEDIQKNKNLTAEQTKKQFIGRFNELTRKGLMESVLKEKLTSIKNKDLKIKLFSSLFPPAFAAFSILLDVNSKAAILTILIQNVLINIQSADRSSYVHRHIDHPFEFTMPMVEIDKVIEAAAYLNTKGRTLVKESKSPKIGI